MAPSMAEPVAPVTAAEIELTELATVTHMSIATPAEYGCTPQALVLVRLHTVPMGAIVVDAPAGTVRIAPSLVGNTIYRLIWVGGSRYQSLSRMF